MSGTRNKDESGFDLEQQFLLRLPEGAARYLLEDIKSGVSFKDNLTFEMKNDMRHGIVRYNGQVYQARVMDLPCIIESHKTMDRKTFYKTADISQIVICTQDDDGAAPIRGSAAYLAARSSHTRPQSTNPYVQDNREFQYLHGITPPLKNVLRRRFRKTRRKRSVDMPQIEKEVKALLSADIQASDVIWEVVWSDPPNVAKPAGEDTSANEAGGPPFSSGKELVASTLTVVNPGASGGGSSKDDDDPDSDDGTKHRITALDDLFGVISSSSTSDGGSDESDGNYSDDGGSNSEADAGDDEADGDVDVDDGVGGGDADRLEGDRGVDEEEGMVAADSVRAAMLSSTREDEVPEDSGEHDGIDAMGPIDVPTVAVEPSANELAAQLLLSSDEEEEEDEEGVVMGQLIDFHCVNTSEEAAATATSQLASLDEGVIVGARGGVDLLDEDDDDFVPAGGELLADDDDQSGPEPGTFAGHPDDDDVDLF